LRDLVVAMIVARVLDPRSKLATARGLQAETAFTSLGECLGVSSVSEDELYAAMDWLLERQPAIERRLARRHLADGVLVLYDVTSVYLEGACCPVARYGHSRDGKRGKLQIVFGLLCDAEGRPVAVELFEGDVADPKTLPAAIGRVRERFGLKRVVLVGDRGLLTEARLREEVRPVEGLDWITALRAPAIRKLAEGGHVQMSLFDERNLAEIRSPDYPGERLILCRNPLLADERRRKREALLRATERDLERIAAATRRARRPLRGRARIGLRVGPKVNRFKMAKHFHLTITDDTFAYERRQEKIAEEAALDGLYVIRTSVPSEALPAEKVVRAYKGLAVAERAFRSLKSVDLKVRPVFHYAADRVRAHVFLCLLAYYVEWHMRRALAELLFDDENPEAGEARRASAVAPAQRSPSAEAKAAKRRGESDLPVHSFQTLLTDLGTLAKNRVRPASSEVTFDLFTNPTAVQQRAFELLGVSHRM
jgi:hypothetical protein